MKLLTVTSLILVTLACSIIAQSDWELVSILMESHGLRGWTSPPPEILTTVYDDLTWESQIVISSDTGLTFDVLYSNAWSYNIHPTDHNTILVVDEMATIHMTTDRGVTWTSILDNCYRDIAFSGGDPDVIWAIVDDPVSWENRVMRSADCGSTFTDVSGDLTGSYYWNLITSYANGDIAFVLSDFGLMRTTNAGTNWTTTLFPGVFVDEVRLFNTPADPDKYMAIADMDVYLSEDAGSSWIPCTLSTPGFPYTGLIDPWDANCALIVMDDGVHETTDWGATWELWPSGGMMVYLEDITVIPVDGYRKYFGGSWEGLYKRGGEAISGGPRLYTRFPADDDWISEDTVIILGFSDADGIDASTAAIDVNGTPYTIADAELTAVGDSLFFRDTTPWTDGDIVVTMDYIEDALGEASPDSGRSFTFHVDKTPPELLFYEPDSGAVLSDVPSGIMIVFHDAGCGNSEDTWDFTDGTVTLGSYSTGVMIEGSDTIFIDFTTAGVSIDPGDTVSFLFRGWDIPDIGGVNQLAFWWSFIVTSSIDETELPSVTDLTVFPNPFNSSVKISLSVIPGLIRNPEIQIFDINGHMVAQIPVFNSPLTRGVAEGRGGYEFVWTPDAFLGSGIYLIRAKIGEESVTKRIVYLK